MNFPEVNSAEELIQQGRFYHSNKDMGSALQCYQQVLSEAPHNADALHLTGLIAYEWGRHQEALQLFDKAIKLNPHNYQYYNEP